MQETLSPWWRRSAILTIVLCFSVLGWLTRLTYSGAPPIPERVVGSDGTVLFTSADIAVGQQVFLRYGLMENGTLWGHGAYLGPDFSAQYLYTLALDAGKTVAKRNGLMIQSVIATNQRLIVNAEVARLLKHNRYDTVSKTLKFTEGEASSYRRQIALWTNYFKNPQDNAGLPHDYITDPVQLRELTRSSHGRHGLQSRIGLGATTRTQTISHMIPRSETFLPAAPCYGARSA